MGILGTSAGLYSGIYSGIITSISSLPFICSENWVVKILAVWSTAAVASIRCSWSGAVFAETSKWQLRTGWWCSWSSCWRAPRGRRSLTGRGRLWLPWKRETEPAACWTNSELFTNRWVAPSVQLSVDCVPLEFPLLWSSFFFCLISSFFSVCVWALVLV